MFRTSPVNLAVVVDEYGSVEGIVSPTDILEVVAGAVPEHGEAVESEAEQRDDGSWLIDGMMQVDEFEARLGAHGRKEARESDTVDSSVLGPTGRAANRIDRMHGGK